MKRIFSTLTLWACALALLAGCVGNSAAPGQGEGGPASKEAPAQPPASGGEGESSSEEGPSSSGATQGEAGQETRTAMYVPYGEGAYVLVDQENGAVFTVTMPEALYGVGGEKITPADLRAGNLVEITGNGIMLNSYPGQYPGVARMRVTQEGQPADAGQYQDIIDSIYTPPDPSEPPSLNIEYRTPQAIVTAMANRGSYTWRFPGEDGEEQELLACGAHILHWGELNDLTLPAPTELTLQFFEGEPKEVRVERWPVAHRTTDTAVVPEAGEAVPVRLADGLHTLQAEAGYVYLVRGIWEKGEVEFGFHTK